MRQAWYVYKKIADVPIYFVMIISYYYIPTTYLWLGYRYCPND